MKFTLPVGGVEMTFTEEELTAILKEHFNKASMNAEESIQNPLGPREGVPFEVNPKCILRAYFQKQRQDPDQEMVRILILEALGYVDKYPEKYDRPFKILIPEKTWEYKETGEMKDLAERLGGHMTNWIEQALEWAQRFAKGGTWEDICSNADTAPWYRLINWKDGTVRAVGGARMVHNMRPATDVGSYKYASNFSTNNAVPSITIYE